MGKNYIMFLKEVCYAHQKYSKSSNTVKYYYKFEITVFYCILILNVINY